MRKFEITTKYKNSGIEIPKRATKSSAGYDLASAEDIVIKPKEIVLIPTGLKVKFPSGEVMLVFPRSSLAIKKGLMMSNGVGVVDSDYYGNEDNEGHLMVPIINFTDSDVKVEKGERIAQGIFVKYHTVTNDITIGDTRDGGFGSSGQ
ncbi:MAG: dUTP diphosphatase [Acholeplasmataceae bacterium]|jgi:dUTP pyrophosphatase|nr:dUTP diphosphatase [Acholeplasmataceae bacterium]